MQTSNKVEKIQRKKPLRSEWNPNQSRPNQKKKHRRESLKRLEVEYI